MEVMQTTSAHLPAPRTYGAYCLVHVATGMMILGSTEDLHARRESHFRLLQQGLHPCRELQRLYSNVPTIGFEIWPCLSKAEAKEKEAELYAELSPSGRLFNTEAPQVPFTPRTSFDA